MLAKTLMTVQNKSAMPTPAMAPPLVLSNQRLDKADNSLRNFLVALELGHQLFAEHLLDAEAWLRRKRAQSDILFSAVDRVGPLGEEF